MKIIELLNKIANGEEVPFEIKLFGVTFYFNNEKQCYFSKYDKCNILDMHSHCLRNKGKLLLNEEVEILEEEPRDIEVCGSLFTKSEYDKLAHSEEEKKIPEKLKKKKTINGSFEGKTTYIYKYNEYEIGETINEIIDYLDYLKSKGE